jgi:hypothetical protein
VTNRLNSETSSRDNGTQNHEQNLSFGYSEPTVIARHPPAHIGTYGLPRISYVKEQCGLGGQDWDGPHLMVGKLLLGHTVRNKLGGWGRQVIMKTSPGGESAGYWVRPHPHSPLSLA